MLNKMCSLGFGRLVTHVAKWVILNLTVVSHAESFAQQFSYAIRPLLVCTQIPGPSRQRAAGEIPCRLRATRARALCVHDRWRHPRGCGLFRQPPVQRSPQGQVRWPLNLYRCFSVTAVVMGLTFSAPFLRQVYTMYTSH